MQIHQPGPFVLGFPVGFNPDHPMFITGRRTCLRECQAGAVSDFLRIDDISGLVYNPLTRKYRLDREVDVNYMVSIHKDADA